jgi:hypothetical protein
MNTTTLAIGLVCALIAFACLVKAGVIKIDDLRALMAPPYKARRILTDNEIHFAGLLRQAVPEYQVLPQVSFGAFLEVKGALGASAATTAFNKISSKRADFVVCDNRFEVLCIVELDDRTHDSDKDAKRDSYTSAAGLQTLRFQSRSKPQPDALRRAIIEAVQRAKPRRA